VLEAALKTFKISIKGVPAYVCKNCGEAYFTPEISRKMDEVEIKV